MKKTAIVASILSLFVVIGVANAQTPTKLTPRQKIAAMRLAKMKKKPIVIVAGTMNTGVTCNVEYAPLDFVGTTGLWSDNISGASAQLQFAISAIMKMDGKQECTSKYNDLRQRHLNNATRLQKIIDDNRYYLQDDKVKNLRVTYDREQSIYRNCIAKSKNSDDVAMCGRDPTQRLMEAEALLATMKKPQ